MKSEIQITNTAEVCRIEIEGTIGVPEEWQFDDPAERVATYEKFRDAVRRIGEIEAREVVVDIRSTGGDVNDALLIHDALRQTGARITTRCYGYTASAATIIAQAASEGRREISANALYLIHTAVCATEGNAAELAAKTELLRQTDARIAAIYAERSQRPVAEFERLMAENNGNGRWLSPEEALEAGLVDRIVEMPEMAGEAGGSGASGLGGLGGGRALARNIVRGWRRLFSGAERDSKGRLPADRNVLHGPEGLSGPVSGSATVSGAASAPVSAEERRRQFGPTRTQSREDPSCTEPLHSANELAYSEDARRFRSMA